MKKMIFLILVCFFTSLFAQDKYMIYFKDKGRYNYNSLSKSADKESLAQSILSKRSIERRKKHLGEDFISFEDLPIEEQYINKIRNIGVKVINKLKWFNAVSAYLSENQIEQIQNENYIAKIKLISNTSASPPLENNSTQLNRINKSSSNHNFDYGNSLIQNELSEIPDVHDLGITGEGVIIGLLDSGFDWETHTSLKEREVIAEYDFIFNDSETANDSLDATSTQHNHGTNVFSIIAGFDEGKLVGPAFNSQFILAKTEFVPTETHSEEDNYAAALEWMDSIGVDITSSSLGYSDGFEQYGEISYTYEDMNGKNTIVTKAAELAFEKGIIVITSAGNEGNSPWRHITAPGDGLNTITVGAVNSTNQIASFSGRGPTFDGRIKPELVAQGIGVNYARGGTSDNYGSSKTGTSFSAPIVTGIAGLLLSAHPHLINQQVRSILIKSGDNFKKPNNDIGYGLISAINAITYPNLEENDGSFILHKIFDKNIEIDEETVGLVFNDTIRLALLKDGIGFRVELPEEQIGEFCEFYLTYKDNQNNSFREPVDNNYKIEYGKLNIDIISSIPNGDIPENYSLSQNYPNPFNPDTRINYFLPESHGESIVRIKLYDILGREVKTLLNKIQNSGEHFIEFSAIGLSTGVYFYQLTAKDFTQTKKLTILK